MTESPANAYLRTKVLTASPEELRLMLLDGALKFAHQGLEGLRSRHHEQSYNGISQCRNIVLELLTTIRPEFDPAMCDRVKALYTFMYSTLVDASMERSIDKLQSVIQLLEYERETWTLLMDQLTRERAAGREAIPAVDRPAPAPEARERATLSISA